MAESTDRKTILVVDDEPALLTLMGRYLEGQGWLALLAGGADDALKIVDRYPDELDLLITDIVLPDTNGFVLAAQVLDRRPHLPILYVSGHFADDQRVRYGLREAGRYFLRKPFFEDDFLPVVTAAMAKPVEATDGFAVILGHPLITADVVQEWRRHAGTSPRDLRYRLELAVRYRLASMTSWATGLTRNLSRTGLSFEASESIPDPRAPGDRLVIDLRLALPTVGEGSAEVACQGYVTRVERSPESDGATTIGITVDRYHVDIRP